MAMTEKTSSAPICTMLITMLTPVVPVTPRKAMYATPAAKRMQKPIMKSGLLYVPLKVSGKNWLSR